MRRGLLLAATAMLAALWLGPLPGLAHRSFTAHMVMHMGVVAVAAGLAALALAGTRLDPARRAPRLFAPIPAMLGELVVVWGWHAPAPHAWARHEPWGLVLEQGSFLLVGLWLWLSALGGGGLARPGGAGAAERAAAGVAGLLLTSMHMTLLGALLALSPRPLYEHAAPAAWGLSPLADQHLGGAVMLLVGSACYLAGGLWLAAGLVRGRLAAGSAAGDAP
jgi:putative membrane protein